METCDIHFYKFHFHYPFISWIIDIFFMTCMDCLYILKIILLLVIYVVNINSLPEKNINSIYLWKFS